jgi:hypothetical protein
LYDGCRQNATRPGRRPRQRWWLRTHAPVRIACSTFDTIRILLAALHRHAAITKCIRNDDCINLVQPCRGKTDGCYQNRFAAAEQCAMASDLAGIDHVCQGSRLRINQRYAVLHQMVLAISFGPITFFPCQAWMQRLRPRHQQQKWQIQKFHSLTHPLTHRISDMPMRISTRMRKLNKWCKCCKCCKPVISNIMQHAYAVFSRKWQCSRRL